MFLYLSLIETEEDKIKFEAIFNNYKKIMYYVRGTEPTNSDPVFDEIMEDN